MRNLFVAAAVTLLAASPAMAQQQRAHVWAAGSSTVFPFASAAAESFGRQGKFKTPVVESIGTGGGIKSFCLGNGVQFPDIADASRPITASEKEQCAKSGVAHYTEIRIGYDGITLADQNASATFPVTTAILFKALAKEVPVDGKIVANPYKTWKAVDPSLPDREIKVFGPAPNHGTRDAWNELVMDPGCESMAEIKALPKDQQKKVCNTIREDGAWIEVSENYNLIVQKLTSTPGAIGVFGFSFLDQNMDKLHGFTVNGVAPTFDNISTGKYPVSRPLFIYVKDDNSKLIPGLKEFVTDFLSDKMVGKEGAMVDKGLIPMSTAELKAQQALVAKLP